MTAASAANYNVKGMIQLDIIKSTWFSVGYINLFVQTWLGTAKIIDIIDKLANFANPLKH